jgi:hypothetical protein
VSVLTMMEITKDRHGGGRLSKEDFGFSCVTTHPCHEKHIHLIFSEAGLSGEEGKAVNQVQRVKP